MNRPVNYKRLRAEITFLFRLIMLNNKVMVDVGGSKKNIDDDCSKIATLGTNLIFTHRSDDGFTISPEEQNNSIGIGQAIIDSFQKSAIKIHDECFGLPITLSVNKEELILRAEVDELIETLKFLFEGKKEEVNNG
jgi:hypothetical protein